MSDNKTVMAQENFSPNTTEPAAEPGDFSSDKAALAWAEGQLDKLIGAMRYKLEKHVVGWPEDDRELNTYEAFRHLLRDINFGHSAYVEADYENPAFAKMGATSRINFQLPSPDCMYHSVVLHSDYTYLIKGKRGSAAIFQLAIYAGHACDLVGWKTVSVANNIDQADHLWPGAEVNIVLSKERPADLGHALWMEMPEGPSELHSRQYYGDWLTEEPADLMIRMESQTFPAKVLDAQSAATRFDRLVNLLRVHTDFYRAGVESHLRHEPGEIPELVFPGAFVGTTYFPGHLRCQPDEAVIIEIEDTGSGYWNTALFQMQFENLDWWSRSSSFNSTQAHVDGDGKVRFVASWSDPGVPNWLDCSGRVLSLIAFRFFRAPTKPANPTLRTVPLADVRDHLPADTPTVTPDARHRLLSDRLVSAYRRRMADF
ncbi:hypothetical protein [Novosphingobium sp. 9U]|uniref:hypothetical protein n=1 Tax=Novosphingobium sp. 9U TaxID=2653158 RepID=UPI0012F374BE|nr:hypothetical protein [Novosphingobium sp. 9U]VWX48258.1 conserved hypothetical protein [Novosphingobium sp. 9U]